MSTVERECLAILHYMAKNGYTTLQEIAGKTNVSFANVQRYLNEECWEVAPTVNTTYAPGKTRGERQSMWLERQRRINPKLYWRYVPTLRPEHDPKAGETIYRINRAKRDVLMFWAHVHHFDIVPTKTYPGFTVIGASDFSYNGDGAVRHAYAGTNDEPYALISSTH